MEKRGMRQTVCISNLKAFDNGRFSVIVDSVSLALFLPRLFSDDKRALESRREGRYRESRATFCKGLKTISVALSGFYCLYLSLISYLSLSLLANKLFHG